MLRVDRTVRSDVAARPAACLALLADPGRYPEWARLVREAEVRDGTVHLRVEVLGMSTEMECALELGPEGAVLRRLPYDDADDERFTATFAVRPAGAGAAVELHVAAAIDVPGAASFLRGRIGRRLADDLLADLAAAASKASD